MRSISRVLDVSINTVSKLLEDVGKACAAYHDQNVRGVAFERIQCDEIWSDCYVKAMNVAAAKAAPEGIGDVWTWTAMDADSKLIVSYLVGGRDTEYVDAFMGDLAGRLANRVQITTNGHKVYLEAVEDAFSKKFENHAHMVALYTVWYNFVKMHKKHRMSPAMTADVSDRLWSLEDVAALVEIAVPEPKKRGPYKKV